MEQYDQSVGTFSPDGKIYQVEYALKAVEAGGYAQRGLLPLLSSPHLPPTHPLSPHPPSLAVCNVSLAP